VNDHVAPVVAVLIPCRNEAPTVSAVVAGFRHSLPQCRVYVYDNGSSDGTSQLAKRSGALVRCERIPGKGGVVRRMFAEVDADVYLLVDGDGTYDPAAAPLLIRRLLEDDLDMVTAVRDHQGRAAAYRSGHQWGNRAFNRLLHILFGHEPADLFSGYRVFSRRFVKSFPAASNGFEIETELTVHALEQRLPTGEVIAPYFERPSGSTSKLSTWRDGARILRMMIVLYRDERPLPFFGAFAIIVGAIGLGLGIDVTVEFLSTHLVRRFPTAILATGLMLTAFMFVGCGLILDQVARGRREAKRLAYLSQSAH